MPCISSRYDLCHTHVLLITPYCPMIRTCYCTSLWGFAILWYPHFKAIAVHVVYMLCPLATCCAYKPHAVSSVATCCNHTIAKLYGDMLRHGLMLTHGGTLTHGGMLRHVAVHSQQCSRVSPIALCNLASLFLQPDLEMTACRALVMVMTQLSPVQQSSWRQQRALHLSSLTLGR